MFPWRRAAACLLLVLLLSCHRVSTARPAPPSKHLAELKSNDNAFDDRTEAAEKRPYQSRLGLSVASRLDAATLGRIASTRCGVGDGHVPVHSRFALLDGYLPRWPGPPGHLVLTYSISPTTNVVGYMPPEAVRAAFRSAFARWAEVIPVEFVEVDDVHYRPQADIMLSFFEADHGDGDPFDGVGGVLAHTDVDGAEIHFDAAEHWTVDVGSEAARSSTMDLETVAIHEIGHALGLDHSSSPEAVMYPFIGWGERQVELSADDIDGVQRLYGANPLFSRHERHGPAPLWRRSWFAGSVSLVGVVLVVLVITLSLVKINPNQKTESEQSEPKNSVPDIEAPK